MGTAMQRAKAKTARAKPVRAPAELTPAPPDSAPRAVDAPEAILERIFADLPEAAPDADVSDVQSILRRNRRERGRRRLLDALLSRGPYALSEVRHTELQMLAERWAQKGFADAFHEVDDFEVRCAGERAVLDAAARGDEEERFAAAERAHRREVVKRHGRIEIRGLQLSARVYQDLEVAYVPLHVEDQSESQTAPAPKKKKSNGKAAKAAASDIDLEALTAMVRAMERPRVLVTHALARHPRLFLVGGPGSGKSTLLAYLATIAAGGKLATTTGWDADPLPFLIPARSLHGISIGTEVLARAAGAEDWFLEAALRSGRAWLLVDGIDEARPETAAQILATLGQLLNENPGVRALITTRPAATLGEDELAPAGFARVRLVPMTTDEVGEFVDRWCLAAERSLGKSQTQAEADARIAAEDLKERIRARGAIEKLAQTPLLCSVICIVHRFLGQRIPARRVALYEAITNVLLYEWDCAKFPDKPDAALGKLDAQSKRALLARLARQMHEDGVAEVPTEQVIASFSGQLPDLGYAAEQAQAIVEEIRDRAGVLVERSPGSFAFSHLTFQEYLAAMEAVNRREYALLLERYQDEWWHEVIVLAAGFPGADAAGLVRGLLSVDGETVGKGTMLAAQCAETAVELPVALRSDIETKVLGLIPPETPQALEAVARLGEVAGPVLLSRLESADADGRAAILMGLTYVRHEPAIHAIGRFLKDSSATTRPIPLNFTKMISHHPPVVVCATFAMVGSLKTSTTALAIFLEVIPVADPLAIALLRTVEPMMKSREIRGQIRALLQRYDQAHPTARASSPSPRRAARSG